MKAILRRRFALASVVFACDSAAMRLAHLALVVGPLLATACGDDDPSGAGGGSEGGGGAGQSSSSATTSSSSSSTGGGGGGESATLDEAYCTPLAELVCERATDCGCAVAFPAGLDEALCVEAYRSECLGAYAQVDASVEAGDARILPDAAAACVAQIAAATPGCEPPRGSVALGTCPAWFTSDVALGGDCTFPICADGDGYCSEGECVARPGEGDDCNGYECAPGLLCLDGTCQAPGDEDAACTTDDACAPPLRCIDGACGALLAEEDACVTTDDCALGLACDESCGPPATVPCAAQSDCGNLSFCAAPRACRTPGGADDPCVSTDDCLPGYGCDADTSTCTLFPGEGLDCQDGVGCAPGLGCDTTTILCAPLPGDGEPCAQGSFGAFLCAEGLGCADTGTCAPMPGEGATCTIDSRCAEGLGCAFGPGGSTCIVPKVAGGTCENDATCAAAFHCGPGGTCAPDVATGATCPYGNECPATDTCAPDAGTTFRCTPLPAEDDACFFDCDDGLVCAQVPSEATCVPAICDAL